MQTRSLIICLTVARLSAVAAADFNRDIRPLLQEHCVECYGEKKQKDELRLDAKGHRLRADISGADFPLYDRNPNTSEGIFSAKTAIATEQEHHKPGALPRIILPVQGRHSPLKQIPALAYPYNL